jgi:hypothetical protein
VNAAARQEQEIAMQLFGTTQNKPGLLRALSVIQRRGERAANGQTCRDREIRLAETEARYQAQAEYWKVVERKREDLSMRQAKARVRRLDALRQEEREAMVAIEAAGCGITGGMKPAEVVRDGEWSDSPDRQGAQ